MNLLKRMLQLKKRKRLQKTLLPRKKRKLHVNKPLLMNQKKRLLVKVALVSKVSSQKKSNAEQVVAMLLLH
jgi:hypothetical protein